MLKTLARLMAMDDRTWQRHANPWSVWTRFWVLPLLALAIWSRDWLGWGALVPVAAVAIFTLINPRLFPPPRTLDGWPQRAVMGERIYLTGHAPPTERRASTALNIASGLSILPFAYGLWRLDPGWTLASMLGIAGFKTWFVARMARLYDATPPEMRP